MRAMTEISISYGVVLYELGISDEAIERTGEILKSVPEVRQALTSPAIGRESKHRIIERVFPGEIHNFLKVMCGYNHIGKAEEAFAAYRDYRDKRQGILRATLYYVTKPGEDQETRIRAFLCERYGCKEVALEMTEAPQLLGGFIIKVGNREFDWSIRGRMQQLKRKMIRR